MDCFANARNDVAPVSPGDELKGCPVVDRLVAEAVELATCGIVLDLLVETRGIELLEPGPESQKLVFGQFRHGLFDIFNGHGYNIQPRRMRAKPRSYSLIPSPRRGEGDFRAKRESRVRGN
jgi:hypothetical protein